MELSKVAVLKLASKANAMPRSESKMALLEQAIGMSDQLEDIELGFNLRRSLMDVTSYMGHGEKSLVAFAWCLAKFDENPENFDYWQTHTLYWTYKWILGDLIEFPSISLQKALELHEDFARRYREAGHSERTVHYYNMRFAKHRGLKEEAKEHYELWQNSKRDSFSDCFACETSVMVTYHSFIGDDELALKTAQPILDGEQSCATEPRDTYSNVLVPLVKLGKLEEAENYHKKGLAMFKSSKEGIDSLGDHLRYLALVKQLDQAVELFEKHLDWALKTTELDARFTFLIASYLMLQRLVESGEDTLSVRLPKDYALYKEDRIYDIKELSEDFYSRLGELADSFDHRNQTSFYKESIQAEINLLSIL